MKRLFLPIVVVIAGALAPQAHAAGGQLLILQDDARSLGQPDATAAEFRALGADVAKLQLLWDQVAPSGRRKPAGFDGADPSSYHWGAYSSAINSMLEQGLRPYVSLGGRAPRWATRGRGRPGTSRPSAKEFRLFAEAAGRQFPGVRIWSIWNEPNLYSWLSPQRSRGVPKSPSIYRKLYLAGHAGLRASGHGRDRILLGELMPRGGRSPRKIQPLVFLREMFCLNSRYRRYRGRAARLRGCSRVGRIPTSGLAYHPYTLRGGPSQNERARGDAAIGQLGRVAKTLDALARRKKLPKRLRIWISEFGYQTNPPDPSYGVRLKRAAAFMDLGEWIAFRNRRVASYSQYTVIDDLPRSGGRPFQRWSTWQSGLRFSDGRPKPRVYGAFQLPFLVRSIGGNVVELFGGGRGGPGQTARIEAKRRGGRYRVVASITTNRAGYFRQILPLKNAFRQTFRVTLGGLTRVKRPTAF